MNSKEPAPVTQQPPGSTEPGIPDLDRIGEQVNAVWSDYAYPLVTGGALLVVALVVTAAVKLARSSQRDRAVAGLTALVVLAWTSEGLWEVARFILGLPLGFAVMTFFVYEAMMLTCGLQAERHRKHHPSPGPAGRYVWVLAAITATVVALNAQTLVEALLRFTLPLAAAGLWWVGITAERDDDPDEVKQLRDAERKRREANWAISWRLLVAAGVMRPGAQTLTDAERERRIRQMVTAADKLQSATPGSRRADRALQRLRRLARLASANDIAAVRARVARTTRIAELVMPATNPAATGDHLPAQVPHQGNGHAPPAGSPVSGKDSGVSPGTASEVLVGTAPLHPDPPAGVSGNGAASVKHQPETGASRDGGREAAERVYRNSLREGRPLSSRDVARIVGCSPTTAWRATRAVKQAKTSDAASPDGAGPAAGGTSTDTDAARHGVTCGKRTHTAGHGPQLRGAGSGAG